MPTRASYVNGAGEVVNFTVSFADVGGGPFGIVYDFGANENKVLQCELYGTLSKGPDTVGIRNLIEASAAAIQTEAQRSGKFIAVDPRIAGAIAVDAVAGQLHKSCLWASSSPSDARLSVLVNPFHPNASTTDITDSATGAVMSTRQSLPDGRVVTTNYDTGASGGSGDTATVDNQGSQRQVADDYQNANANVAQVADANLKSDRPTGLLGLIDSLPGSQGVIPHDGVIGSHGNSPWQNSNLAPPNEAASSQMPDRSAPYISARWETAAPTDGAMPSSPSQALLDTFRAKGWRLPDNPPPPNTREGLLWHLITDRAPGCVCQAALIELDAAERE